MNLIRFNKQVSGVTLVELMVALLISSILLLGVAKIYTTSKSASKTNNDFAVMQEDGRIALKFLVEDIRMAGYMGCAFNNGGPQFKCYLSNNNGGSYICNDLTTGIIGYDFIGTEADTFSGGQTYTLAVDANNKLVQGTEATDWRNGNGTGLPAQFPAGAIAGSDIIIVKHGGSKGFQLTNANNSGNLQISDDGTAPTPKGAKNCHAPTGICEGDVLLVSDCTKGTVFQANQLAVSTAGILNIIHNNPGNPTPGNSKINWTTNLPTDVDHYSMNDSNVMEFRTWAYYVANNVNGEPALFRHDGISGHPAQELVEGVESMQILYGVDTNNSGTANYYASANQVDFTNATKPIVSVRISLLIRSKNQPPRRPAASKAYNLATTSITNVADKRLRKIFTTTIKIRNKGQVL